MPNTFTAAMDVTKPAGTRSLLFGDDDIREFKVQYCERFNIDHMQPQSEAGVDTVGFHRKATLLEQASDPTAVADAIIAYAKLSGSYSELHVQHENAGVIQLTRLGKLWIESLGIASEAEGDIIVRTASKWDRLARGSALQYLRRNSGDTANEWATLNFQTAATQAEMEAASSITVPVTPGRALYHPCMPKGWGFFDGTTAGTNAPTAGSGVTSITRNAEGHWTVNLSITMSSTNYAVTTGYLRDGATAANMGLEIWNKTTTSFDIKATNSVDALRDCVAVYFSIQGDI